MVICSLAISSYLAPTLAVSDSVTYLESSQQSDSPVHSFKSTNTSQNQPQDQNKHNRKKILIDDSRGLSAFFILGIAINIIMAVTFAWWFTREWRKTKK
jgi:hypothetical protein